MSRFLCFMLCLCFTTTVMLAHNSLYSNINKEKSVQSQTETKYKIYSIGETIYISQVEDKSYVMLFDSSGRNIYKKRVGSGSLTIPTTRKGIYILRIQNSKEIFTQRVLVKD